MVAVRPEPAQDMRRDDQQALEEIRLLFARYRQAARHGQARERDRAPETSRDEANRATVVSTR
jgi:hypothetical protein